MVFVNQVINKIYFRPKVSPKNSMILGMMGASASYRSLARVESYGLRVTITVSTVAIFLVQSNFWW